MREWPDRGPVALALGLITVFLLGAGAGIWSLQAGADPHHRPAAERTASTRPAPPPPPALPRPPDAGWLAGVLVRAGIRLPRGASVYLGIVPPGASRPRAEYDAGDGRLAAELWPASAVKPVVALAVLERLAGWGFTGQASVTVDGWEATVIDLADAALRVSSNEAYDLLVQIAGVDWLNDEFLVALRGFPATVVQRTYTDGDLHTSPAMTISEGGRRLVLPERYSDDEFGVDGGGNRSNLAEMIEAIRLITLAREGAVLRGSRVAPADLDALADALLGSDNFFAPGVRRALGPRAQVWSKPGWGGGTCVEVGLITAPGRADRYLLGVALPDEGDECAALAEVAAAVLRAVRR